VVFSFEPDDALDLNPYRLRQEEIWIMALFRHIFHPPLGEMLAENNTCKGFFEHGEFLALRKALPGYPEFTLEKKAAPYTHPRF
jgi:hypothetical protein